MTEIMMIFAVIALICFGGLMVTTVFLGRQIKSLKTMVDQQNVIMQSILLRQRKIEKSCEEIAMVNAAIQSQYKNICEAYDRICAEHKKLLGTWKDIYEEYSDNKTSYESLVTNLDGISGIVEDISDKLTGLGHQFTELNETLKQADISFAFGAEGGKIDVSTAADKVSDYVTYNITGVDTSPPRFQPDFKRVPGEYLEDDDGR